MPGQLRIETMLTQTAQRPFPCHVHITGGLPGDDVVLRLWQTAGVEPLYADTRATTLDGTGGGMVTFLVTLAGPCHARLVVDDQRSAAPLTMTDVHIEVRRAVGP